MVCLIITDIHIYDSTNEHTNVQAGNIFIWKEVRVGVIYWNSTSQGHPTRIQLKPLKHSIVESILVFKG